MYPPTANRPLAVLYLHQTKLSTDHLAKLTGIWRLARKRHRPPAPARQWRSEAKSARIASEKLQAVLSRWAASGEMDTAKATLDAIMAKLRGVSRLASYLEKRHRTGAADVLRRADEKLRFATLLAQIEPKLGLRLRARQVAAIAVIVCLEQGTSDDEVAGRRVLQNWERTWKTARRLAAALRRGEAELNKQVPASPQVSGIG
jgi:hypothetical protein